MMPWMQTAADIYSALIWPLVALCVMLAAYRHDIALFRCASVTGAGQLFINLWGQYAMTPDSPQPVWAMLGMYTAQAIAVTVLPSGLVCVAMSAVFIGGVVISILHVCLPITFATESLYWANNLLLALASVLILAGGAAGESGKRVVYYLWRLASHVAHRSRAAGAS